MKTQKLTLAAVLATTLLSTSAFAATDFDIENGKSANTQINLSLKIDQKCTIHGLDKASNNATFDSSTNKATISGFYADCNDSSATPQIKFSSINGLNSSDPTKSSYQLADSNGEKISYGIKIGTTDATVNTAVNIPKASADIVFTATPTQSATSPTSGTYSDTVTATITL